MVPLLVLLAGAAHAAPLTAPLAEARAELSAKGCAKISRANRSLCHDADLVMQGAARRIPLLERCLASPSCPASDKAEVVRWARSWVGVRQRFPKVGLLLEAMAARALPGLTQGDLGRSQAAAYCHGRPADCPSRAAAELASLIESGRAACADGSCPLSQVRRIVRAFADLEAITGLEGDLYQWIKALKADMSAETGRVSQEIAGLRARPMNDETRRRLAELSAIVGDMADLVPADYARWRTDLNALSASLALSSQDPLRLHLPPQARSPGGQLGEDAALNLDPETVGAALKGNPFAMERIGTARRVGRDLPVTRQSRDACLINSAMQILRARGKLPPGVGEPELLRVATEQGFFRNGTTSGHLSSLLRRYGVDLRHEGGASVEDLRRVAAIGEPFIISVDSIRYLHGGPGPRGESHAIVVTGASVEAGTGRVVMYRVNDSDQDPPVQGGEVPPHRLEPAFTIDGGNLIQPF